MKFLRSLENVALCNEDRRRVKTLIKQAKRRFEENIAAESKNNIKKFFRYINTPKILEIGSDH